VSRAHPLRAHALESGHALGPRGPQTALTAFAWRDPLGYRVSRRFAGAATRRGPTLSAIPPDDAVRARGALLPLAPLHTILLEASPRLHMGLV
jgi:hypothetical protein